MVFLCVQNAGRSQMAAAWARHLGGAGVEVLSGGSRPAEALHPVVIEAMAERGIDLASARPARWMEETLAGADLIVTMGCGDQCPVIPGVRYQDWELPDPAGRPLEEVRRIRDEIERRVRRVLAELSQSAGGDA